MPIAQGPDGTELKFNPWHDPSNGRFTFASAGQYSAGRTSGSTIGRRRHDPTIVYVENPALPPITSLKEVEVWRVEQLAKYGNLPGYREAIEAQYKRYLAFFSHRPDRRASTPSSVRQVLHPAHQTKMPTARSSPQQRFSGGGGDFGGGGASGSWTDERTEMPRLAKPMASLSSSRDV